MIAKMYGLCYGPYREGQDPQRGPRPTAEQIDQDLGFISNWTDRIRVYSSQDSLSNIAHLAAKHNLRVNLGVWISDDLVGNENEIKEAIKIINGYDKSSIECVTVGNEVLARLEWGQSSISADKLSSYIKRVKVETAKHGIPVTTAEPWHVWQKYIKFAESLDIITAHIYAYWDEQSINRAADYFVEKYIHVQSMFVGKKIIICETGWPTGGKTKGQAIPSESNLQLFLTELFNNKQIKKIPYYFFEVFDELWKEEEPGNDVGKHWGMANSTGVIKSAIRNVLPSNNLHYQNVWRR